MIVHWAIPPFVIWILDLCLWLRTHDRWQIVNIRKYILRSSDWKSHLFLLQFFGLLQSCNWVHNFGRSCRIQNCLGWPVLFIVFCWNFGRNWRVQNCQWWPYYSSSFVGFLSRSLFGTAPNRTQNKVHVIVGHDFVFDVVPGLHRLN